mmetsp:Transcript_12260/g.12068  ORF Transcript_12260/g.12068 Transcript_12260/m.12068 type:complete len:106 (+) Transcript_12260:481-798(+)
MELIVLQRSVQKLHLALICSLLRLHLRSSHDSLLFRGNSPVVSELLFMLQRKQHAASLHIIYLSIIAEQRVRDDETLVEVVFGNGLLLAPVRSLVLHLLRRQEDL